MKILCLFVILANISLFIWEYRNGAVTSHEVASTQKEMPSKEPILLASELKNPPPPASPEPGQNPPVDENNPDNEGDGKGEPNVNTDATIPHTSAIGSANN